MEYLLLVISAWMIMILVLSFVKIKVGVSLFLIYMVCVPYVMIRVGGNVWGANVVNTIFLASFVLYVYQKKIKVDWTPFTPFIVYFMQILYRCYKELDESFMDITLKNICKEG